MDPVQKWDPMSISVPSRIATVASSQEASAAPQSSSSEKLSVGLSILRVSPSPSPSPSPSSGVPEGLFQHQVREKKALWQQYWEKQGFPQRKKVFLRHSRRWHRDHMAPYLLERDVRGFPSGDKAQNQLRCQGHVQSIAGMSGQRIAVPNPPSWEMLVQDLNGLTLSLGANRPGPLPEGPRQQQEPEDMCQLERQQESLKMFQRMLK